MGSLGQAVSLSGVCTQALHREPDRDETEGGHLRATPGAGTQGSEPWQEVPSGFHLSLPIWPRKQGESSDLSGSPNPWAAPEISPWPGQDRKRGGCQRSCSWGRGGRAPGHASHRGGPTWLGAAQAYLNSSMEGSGHLMSSGPLEVLPSLKLLP